MLVVRTFQFTEHGVPHRAEFLLWADFIDSCQNIGNLAKYYKRCSDSASMYKNVTKKSLLRSICTSAKWDVLMNVTELLPPWADLGWRMDSHFAPNSWQHGVRMIPPLIQRMVPKPETAQAFSIALETFGLSNVISAWLSQIWHDRKNQFARLFAAWEEFESG